MGAATTLGAGRFVWLAMAVLSGVAGEADRHLHAALTCNNTESGRWYITDDRGMVCPRASLDYATGCCSAGDLHSCASCVADDKCCSRYEDCVSCCLKPENSAQQLMASIFRGRNKPETGQWSTPFEYCRAVCRTTARSTQHENAFILDRRYCFSKLGRPRVPVPPEPPLPKGVTVVAGQPGQNCDVACGTKQLACAAQWFASLNDCNSLRAKFMCEAGCGAGAPDQREFPGYVEGSAPKHLWPALCVFLSPLAPQQAATFNCTRGNGSVRRLCPCEQPPPGVVAAAGQHAAVGAAGTQQAGVQPQPGGQAAAADTQAQQAQQAGTAQ